MNSRVSDWPLVADQARMGDGHVWCGKCLTTLTGDSFTLIELVEAVEHHAAECPDTF